MQRSDGSPELDDFNLVIQFLHRLNPFLVTIVFVGALELGLILMSAPAAAAQADGGTRQRWWA